MLPLTRFEHTYCSQCGTDLGPGDHGASSCCDHGACQAIARGDSCHCDRIPVNEGKAGDDGGRGCPKCGQTDQGQTGEYACPECGLPTVWDAPVAAPADQPVAWLYRDHGGTLKLAQTSPPPDGAFPVFAAHGVKALDNQTSSSSSTGGVESEDSDADQT